MKKLLTIMFLLAYSLPMIAQIPSVYQKYISNNQGERCLSNLCIDKLANAYSGMNKSIDSLVRLNDSNRFQKSLTFSDSVVRIPVVFHIVHNNGSENISKAQIESQIQILNEDYRRIPGTSGFGNGVDTQFEFFLAQKDPMGNCTDGIIRIQSSETSHDIFNEATLKGLSQWDPVRYLNFWVVDQILIFGFPGVLGYATGPQQLPGAPNLDGVVVADDFVGNQGTSGTPPFGFGRTATHEVGHWLGLYHTFEGGCEGLTDSTCFSNDPNFPPPVGFGDGVCDTPPVIAPASGCPSQNTCNENITVLGGDVNDQIENYMDYSDDACMNTFTQGQKDRMMHFTSVFRSTILDSMNAINAGLYGCSNAVSASISGTDTVCIGDNFTLTFNFTGRAPFDVVYTDGLSLDTLTGIGPNHLELLNATQGTKAYSIVSFADQDSTKTAPDSSITGLAEISAFSPGIADASLTGGGFICAGDTSQINLNVNGGTGPFDIEINNGVGVLTGIMNNSSIDVTPIATSAYSLIGISDANGCSTSNFSSTAFFNILQTPNASFQFSLNSNTVTFSNLTANASTYVWDFGDGNTSAQENPVHTYQSTGSYTVIMTGTNANGCEDSQTEVVNISTISSLSGNIQENEIDIYPNPASDQLTISRRWTSSPTVELYNYYGKEFTLDSKQEGRNYILDTRTLIPGLYILKVSDGKESFTGKVLIER